MKRKLTDKELDQDSVNGALGITDAWKESTIDFCVEQILERDRVTEVIETLIHDIKEEEFGEGTYDLTPYEKKLLFAGMLLEKALSAQAKHMKGMESLLQMLKLLNEDPDKDSDESDESEDN